MDDVVINLGEAETKNSECEKLLRMKADTKLNFNERLNNIINKASYKITLSKIESI